MHYEDLSGYDTNRVKLTRGISISSSYGFDCILCRAISGLTRNGVESETSPTGQPDRSVERTLAADPWRVLVVVQCDADVMHDHPVA